MCRQAPWHVSADGLYLHKQGKGQGFIATHAHQNCARFLSEERRRSEQGKQVIAGDGLVARCKHTAAWASAPPPPHCAHAPLHPCVQRPCLILRRRACRGACGRRQERHPNTTHGRTRAGSLASSPFFIHSLHSLHAAGTCEGGPTAQRVPRPCLAVLLGLPTPQPGLLHMHTRRRHACAACWTRTRWF